MAIAGRMTKFTISELSGVDRPAQTGARVTIMKRDSGGDPAKADIGQPPGNQGAAMSTAIKKALGLADTATDAEVEAAITKSASDAAAKLAKAEQDLALLTKVAKMAPPVRAHYEALLKADTSDAKAKAAELADMKEDEQDAAMKKAAAGDETVVIEGRTISKRAVGEDMFAVMKAQAARITSSEAEIKKANDARDDATFAKRASEEFPHLAGTADERALVLKAISKMDDTAKAAAEAILKAAEGHAKFAFARAGAGGGGLPGGSESPEAKLTKLATEYQKANAGTTFAKAYDAVAQANPQLYEEVVNPSQD